MKKQIKKKKVAFKPSEEAGRRRRLKPEPKIKYKHKMAFLEEE